MPEEICFDRQALAQNLRDAGCPAELVEAFLNKVQAGKAREGVRLLTPHRRALLDALHRDAKKIDCLDYLIERISREQV